MDAVTEDCTGYTPEQIRAIRRRAHAHFNQAIAEAENLNSPPARLNLAKLFDYGREAGPPNNEVHRIARQVLLLERGHYFWRYDSDSSLLWTVLDKLAPEYGS